MFSLRSSSICTASGSDRTPLTQRHPLGELMMSPEGELVPVVGESDVDYDTDEGERRAAQAEIAEQDAGEEGDPFAVY